LIKGLHDTNNQAAWDEFVSIYRPMIYRIARRAGLQDADAHNQTQEVFQKISTHIESWKHGQPTGSFRRWLSRVARNAAVDVIRKLKPDSGRGGTSMMKSLVAVAIEEDDETIYKIELQRAALRWAADRVRGEFTIETWNAFWLSTIEGESPEAVARMLNRSVGSVYTARSRVMHRLREEVKSFDWESEA
jgi:RNA polymerase sigma-70 factor (ECF subfamily)